MIGEKTVLAIIPARGGSKGVLRKNIRELAGKPLIAWTIEAAKKSKYIDRLILSSDDAEIIRVAKGWGCDVPFVRPAELSLDDTPGMAPVLHALDQVESYDYVVLLQPTSPLRTFSDIDLCIEKCFSAGAPACVTVVEVEKSPYWMYFLDEKGQMSPALTGEDVTLPRQKLPKAYSLNGAVYVARCEWISDTKTFVGSGTVASIMPRERALDIDTEQDCQLFELLMSSIQLV